MKRQILWAVILVLASIGFASAQGQTGSIAGRVTSPDGGTLPGVTVSVTSPALQGTRDSITDENGVYVFKALPPGVYKVTYELAGFGRVEQSTPLELGRTINLDASMKVATVEEVITVTAERPSVLQQTTVGANYTGALIDSLPTGRTIQGIAALAPGLTTNTPNAGQVTISGAFAFDNVFLVDGVDINDNLFGSPNNLFIEDAIEETQVLTSGISAEYGRFSGGVINAVTKRGGNKFSGSFRGNFTNPSWRDETPLEDTQGIERKSKLSKFYEATLGGPIIKDRLWFFLAGRDAHTNTQLTLPETNIADETRQDQRRYEAKLTGAVNEDHNFSATYTKVSQTDLRHAFSVDLEPGMKFEGRTPSDLFVTSYNGVLASNLFVEAQFSRKTFAFENFGGSSTNIVDSPFLAQSEFLAYNAPYFDATDPEARNNRQISASVSYFLSTGSLGRHDLKFGGENYRSIHTGGNSQSPTSYVFYTDYLTDASGAPVIGSDSHAVPVFTPGVSQLQNWIAVRGAQSDVVTNSLYLNDVWTLNSHWTFNVGARLERASSKANGGITAVTGATRLVPRLAASFDVRGNGRFKLDATYSHYAGKYSETQFTNNSNVGNPDFIYYLYTGPEGQGRGFAPGFDPRNYTEVIGGGFPTANIFYDEEIKSPLTKEWTASAGMQIGASGHAKLIYTDRNTTDFYQSFVTTETGVTNVVKNGVDFGTFSNRFLSNTSDGVREYSALQLQLGYRPMPRWSLEGHYTRQIRNHGNQEGEGTNTPGAPSFFSGYYPELFNEARTYPVGRLNDYQKHKARLWTTFDLGMGRVGNLNIGLLYRFDSGAAFSIVSNGVGLTARQNAIASSLYPDSPGTQPLFYEEGRGSRFFEDAHAFDVALNYSIPVVKSLRPWVKFEVRNALNKTPLVSHNTTVNRVRTGPVDALGLPTTYTLGPNFGKATASTNFLTPREILVSAGIRF